MLIYNFNNWWEWENPQKVTFDPINKHIIINSGETSIDVQIDMYSAWKEWVLQTNNAQWDAAFRTFGGDQTGENQFAPRYFFLINGWKILANNLECVVQTNLYSDDGESPFIINNAAITNRASDVPVVQSEVERRLEYGDRIYFNANSSYVGTTYPNGTIAQPINNIPDAIALATLYNITNFYVLSDVDILDTGNIFQDYSIIADREGLKITIVDGNYLNRMNWVGFEIDGYFSGGTNKFVDCVITNAFDVSGQMKSCQINGNIRIWDSLVTSSCYSGIAGSNTPNWDMNSGRTTSLSIRSYSGGVKLLNCNTLESKTTVELIAGQIKLDPTCTDGYIDLRGVGYLTNDSSGSTVVTTGFIDSFEIYIEETRALDEQLAYGDRIYVDQVSGYTGSTYPVGTIAQPAKNPIDIFALSAKYKIKNYYLLSDFSALSTGLTFEGTSYIGARENLTLFSPGNIFNGCYFDNLLIDVNFSYGTNNKINNCIIINALNINGNIEKSQLGTPERQSTMSIHESLILSSCYSGNVGGFVSRTPIFDMKEGVDSYLAVRDYSGGVEIFNCDTPNSQATIDLTGQAKFSDSCTDGFIDLRGVGYYVDNSTSGCTVKTEGFVNSFGTYIEETRITDERLAYGDKIYYDETSSYTGITYPVGTIAQPVNNPIDAITIAQQYGINIFSVLSNINLSGITGEFFQNYTIIGARENLSVDLNYNDPLHNYFNNMLWENFKMTGLLSGGTNTIENCEVTYLETFKGVIKNSKLVGDIIVHGDTNMLNCYSGDELSTQSREIPNIYLNGDDLGVTLDFRNYSGDLKFSQIENENDYVVVDVNSGKIVLTSGCTNGYIEIRGVGQLIDNSGSGLTINSTGFVNSFDIFLGEINSEIQSSAFENGVWIDVLGVTGTTYPIGTQLNPVNNLEDAVIIANERGFSNLFFNSDYNFESTVNISNFDLIGKGTLETIFTFEEGCILANCLVSNTKLSGLSFGITTINDSYLVNYGSSGIIASNYDVNIYNSIFEGDVIIPSNYTGTLSVIDSKSLGTSVSGRNEIYLNDSGCELLLRGHMGTVHINENNNPNTYVSIDMVSGRVTLDPSITEGKFNLRGVGTLNNLAGSNIDLDTESFINQSNISKAVWDENIGDHLIEGSAGVVIGNLQFNGKVYLDPTTSNTGTTFPVGTESVPVNNLTDAKTIAQNNGFSILNIISTLNVLSGETISFLTLISNNHSRVNVEQGASTMYTNFQDIDLSGTLNGYSIITSGTINSSGLNEFYGIMEETIFNGSLKLSSDNTKDAVIIDVHSGSIDGPSVIDLNGDGAKLSLRGITGAYLFKNKTGSTKPAFIDIYSGRVGFDSTITAGDFTVRGIGNIYLDESTNTTFDLEGLMSQPTVASAVWDESLVNHTIDGTTGRALSLQQFDGKIWLDPTSPYSGTTFPIGTLGVPVNNGADAVSISERENIDTYHLVGIFTSTQNITSKKIIGDSYLDDGLIFNNTIYHNVTFKSVLLSGTATFSNCEFINCAFSDIHGLVGTLNDCIFLDNTPITLASGQTIFNNCRSGVAGNNSPTFDCGIGNVDLSIRAYSGGIKFLNYDDPTDIATVEFVAGRLNLTNTCTDGFISARGVYSIGGLADVGSNFTLDTDARAATVNSVWDENITNHLTPNSTGDALYNVSAGADPNIIANTVWNTQLSAYTADGSAGNSLSEVVLVTSGLTDMTEMKADIKRILGLTQENFRITDHVYTGDNLDSATIKIFNNSSDCDNDVNPLETYYMVALYDSSGKLIDYKVTRN